MNVIEEFKNKKIIFFKFIYLIYDFIVSALKYIFKTLSAFLFLKDYFDIIKNLTQKYELYLVKYNLLIEKIF